MRNRCRWRCRRHQRLPHCSENKRNYRPRLTQICHGIIAFYRIQILCIRLCEVLPQCHRQWIIIYRKMRICISMRRPCRAWQNYSSRKCLRSAKIARRTRVRKTLASVDSAKLNWLAHLMALVCSQHHSAQNCGFDTNFMFSIFCFLEIPLGDTRLLEEHDLNNVLNQLPEDAFNDLFEGIQSWKKAFSRLALIRLTFS